MPDNYGAERVQRAVARFDDEAPMLDARSFTVDELLEAHVGELGRAQLQLLAWASLSFIPMALLLLLMVFTSFDPVEGRLWTCMDADDVECQEALTGPMPVGPGFCALGPGRTQWTTPGDSIISEFGLTCGNAWKVWWMIGSCFHGVT